MSVTHAQKTARDLFNEQRARVAAMSRDRYGSDPVLIAAKEELARLRVAHQADLRVDRIIRAIQAAGPTLSGAQRGAIIAVTMESGDK